MRATAKKVHETWQWDLKSWGYRMAALCAARCGEPELAVELLTLDVRHNQLLPNGHNYQRPGLPAYLPGNGALLLAVAGMCAVFSEAPNGEAPGFPAAWKVRHEGLSPLI